MIVYGYHDGDRLSVDAETTSLKSALAALPKDAVYYSVQEEDPITHFTVTVAQNIDTLTDLVEIVSDLTDFSVYAYDERGALSGSAHA